MVRLLLALWRLQTACFDLQIELVWHNRYPTVWLQVFKTSKCLPLDVPERACEAKKRKKEAKCHQSAAEQLRKRTINHPDATNRNRTTTTSIHRCRVPPGCEPSSECNPDALATCGCCSLNNNWPRFVDNRDHDFAGPMTHWQGSVLPFPAYVVGAQRYPA